MNARGAGRPAPEEAGRPRIRLVLTDLDGTLLRDDKTISRRSAETLAAVQAAGIPVGFSTSRGLRAVEPYSGQIRPDILIANGGAHVWARGTLLRSCEFSAAEAQAVFDAAYRTCGGDVEMTADTAGMLFWNRPADGRSQQYASAAFDDFRHFSSPVMKICVQTDDAEKARQIADCLGGGAVSVLKFSDIPWHAFSKRGATKEAALAAVCSHLGISARHVAAFGDDFSDIGMISACGTGVAMANAIPEVKACADEITPSTHNEDGVARWIS
ncbi:MAG: HAD-IIB family hydrolase, partial [Treponemataceae bacterium]|nr:HAD-IIB family hydrolase [Treponemataceae bacterium]